MRRVIPVDGPFRFDLALRYLATSPATIAERVGPDGYARAFLAGGRPVVARVAAAPPGLVVAVEGPGADGAALDRAGALAATAFGLALDAAGAGQLSERDPVLAPLVARYVGLRPLAIPDAFEALVWAILGQQINVQFAAKTKRALIERYGQRFDQGDSTFWLFPPPERLVAVTPDELRPLQISRQKAVYIAELARAVAERRVDFEALRRRPDEEVIAALTELKGIGRWTAEYLLLRGFGRPDAIPAADMGLRAIAGRLYGLGRHASESELRALAERWAPYRGFAAFYLWFALQQREG